MDHKDREIAKLKRRIAGLEKTLQIVTGYSGRIEKNLKHLFEVVSDTMPVPMLISSADGQILFSNGKAQEIFGLSEQEFYKTDARDLYENAQAPRTFMKILSDYGEVRSLAVSLKKSDGSVFPVSLFSQPLVFEGKDCFLTVIYDLSKIRKEEEKRLAMERQLRQSHKMEAIGTMAGGIAHDFNNILAIIFGRLELAMIMLPGDSRVKRHIRDALTAANRAKTMTMQILAFCRKTEDERKPFHISTVVAEAAKMIKTLTPSNIEVIIRIQSKTSIVMGDPTQIHQILMNFSSNAGYALRDRGGVIEIRLEELSFGAQEKIRIPNLRTGDYVKLTVSDNGPGIDKSVIERVFDPFFTTKPPGEGTGMGLAVVHGIVQSHGGAVTVESEPGRGTAFHCYFPLLAQTEDIRESFGFEKTIRGGSEHILFVDDESDIVDICEQMLEDLGYRVTPRMSSPEALKLFQENPALFDLVITDDTMPKISGRRMVAEMLKIRPDIPVIMITGRETDDKIFYESGAGSVIRKPFSRDELGTRIRETLDKKNSKK
jgi:PAS domain S-box-containing protein